MKFQRTIWIRPAVIHINISKCLRYYLWMGKPNRYQAAFITCLQA